jgi:[NiFe] hydrogenase diaphorase moiety large subunit
MAKTAPKAVATVCARFGHDRKRLLDILHAVQSELGQIDAATVDALAAELAMPRVDVAGVVSFYSFFTDKPRGRVVIRLCNDVPDRMLGADRVGEGLEEELGIRFGETTADGLFSLEHTSCIGMSDQAPAALFNDVVIPNLGPGAARRLVRKIRQEGGETVALDLGRLLVSEYGDGENAHDLVRSPVKNNLRRSGEVIFAERAGDAGLEKALAMSPAEVIRQVKTARLRGRGGAGFPTGLKWEFTRAAAADERYLICNADEGEPGTFKDRVILTERPDLLFEGMTIAGYAIGAREGILYLRGEYAYLRDYLEDVLARRRAAARLGAGICGKAGFDFDIRIQMGAGAYICGEESALISSCEGLRGDPKNRPPFPAQRGYLGRPTSVNNVETLCCVPRILERGAGWFAAIGSSKSTGTKLLSISGDCMRRGVYEVPLGTPLSAVLELCGAGEPIAVQVGGPSGQMVSRADFGREICFDDLATGGALVVFDATRDPLEIASQYLEFFVHESCGYCTPCRVGNVLLKERLDRISVGRGEAGDLDYLRSLAETVKTTSRCGLGQSSPNPVLSTLRSFLPLYQARLVTPENGRQAAFDLAARLAEAGALAGRQAVDLESGGEPR